MYEMASSRAKALLMSLLSNEILTDEPRDIHQYQWKTSPHMPAAEFPIQSLEC